MDKLLKKIADISQSKKDSLLKISNLKCDIKQYDIEIDNYLDQVEQEKLKIKGLKKQTSKVGK